MIQTNRGLVAIEDVCVGDRVFTPAGYSLVTNAGPTKNADKLIEIVTENGSLTCTPDHKILTNRGFVIADELRYTDRIFSGKEWQCTLIGLFSKALPTGFRVNITGETSGKVRGRQTYTELYGYRPMGQFLTDAIYTTMMGMRSTTTFPILDASTEVNTSVNTHWNASQPDYCNRQTNLHYSGRQNGTVPQTGLHGIANLQKKRGKIANGMNAIAINVISRISRLILRAPSSAMQIVSKRLIDCAKEKPLVYDLTVKKNGCYQANGLLVSNCDAFRMLAVAWQNAPVSNPANAYRPLIVGPGNEATLEDMWASNKRARRTRL